MRANLKQFRQNFAPRFSRAYKPHKSWSKLTPKNGLWAKPASVHTRTFDSQLDQLRGAGCRSRNIYPEKATGAISLTLGKLAPGDVVTVTRIDRLARRTFDLFGIVKRIADAKAQFRSLPEP